MATETRTALAYHQDGTLCVAPDAEPCAPLFVSPEAAAVHRVRQLHARQDKPVRSYGMDGYCSAHKPTGLGYWAPPADLRDCPDCRYTEYYVCSHCECPNDEWPCPTVRTLGDVFG